MITAYKVDVKFYGVEFSLYLPNEHVIGLFKESHTGFFKDSKTEIPQYSVSEIEIPETTKEIETIVSKAITEFGTKIKELNNL